MNQCSLRRQDQRSSDGLTPITLRIPDACRLTGIGRSKLYELIKAGEIEIIKIGSITLVPMASLYALVGRTPASASPPVSPGTCVMTMHPVLAKAILTASLAATPNAIRRDLSSVTDIVRTKAEDAVVEDMVAALYDGEHEVGQRC